MHANADCTLHLRLAAKNGAPSTNFVRTLRHSEIVHQIRNATSLACYQGLSRRIAQKRPAAESEAVSIGTLLLCLNGSMAEFERGLLRQRASRSFQTKVSRR